MKKIAILQYDLSVGGIQKSLINLLKSISKDKDYQIDLYLFDKTDFFQEKLNINIIYLKKYPYFYRFIPFWLLMKMKKGQITKTYDIIIDFNSYKMECAINAIKSNAKEKIIWCHNDLVEKYKDDLKYRILWHFFKGKYKYFDKIVAVSEGAKESVIKKLKFNPKNIFVLPNMINVEEIKNKSKKDVKFIKKPNNYNLITVGRLCHQKGYDILLEIMSKVNNNNLSLYIIGDGEDKDKLLKIIKQKGLSNVYLLGKTNNPYAYMKQADGFILTSRYEGQGMVILEAKVIGLDIIIPKKLEKYIGIDDIKGYDNIISVLSNLDSKSKKKEKKMDMLEDYNTNIINTFKEIIFNSKGDDNSKNT